MKTESVQVIAPQDAQTEAWKAGDSKGGLECAVGLYRDCALVAD